MRILLINSHHKILGGSERYYLNLSNLLKSRGHKVAHFSMLDRGNFPTKWSKYFVSHINLTKNTPKDFIRKIFRMPYSFEAKNKINILLDKFRPDIVHINNIYYYISPSILGEIKKRGIPIVQTVHDYQLISPNTILFYNGKVCEVTKKDRYYKALENRWRKPYVATIMSVITIYIQYFFKFFEKNVDYFITPSIFMKNKLLEYGFKTKNIVHLPNFTNFSSFKSKFTKKLITNRYVLFFGRLDEPKGVLFLLR